MAEEQANIVLWPGRAGGTVFGCGAGSMLLGILLLTPVRVRLERLSAASWSMLTALLLPKTAQKIIVHFTYHRKGASKWNQMALNLSTELAEHSNSLYL